MSRTPDSPIIDLLTKRYSPRSFLDKPVEETDMKSILEAGRFAPSCFNEQPWGCVYALKQDSKEFENLLGCLSPKNQSWAESAGALMITAARGLYRANGSENLFAQHDTGLFLMSMLLQGTSMGIFGHPMAGFSRKKATEVLGIPEDYLPVAAVAWGYPGEPDSCPEEFREKEAVRTPRGEVSSFAFRNSWK